MSRNIISKQEGLCKSRYSTHCMRYQHGHCAAITNENNLTATSIPLWGSAMCWLRKVFFFFVKQGIFYSGKYGTKHGKSERWEGRVRFGLTRLDPVAVQASPDSVSYINSYVGCSQTDATLSIIQFNSFSFQIGKYPISRFDCSSGKGFCSSCWWTSLLNIKRVK